MSTGDGRITKAVRIDWVGLLLVFAYILTYCGASVDDTLEQVWNSKIVKLTSLSQLRLRKWYSTIGRQPMRPYRCDINCDASSRRLSIRGILGYRAKSSGSCCDSATAKAIYSPERTPPQIIAPMLQQGKGGNEWHSIV